MIDGWKKVQVQDICTKGSSNIAQNKIEDNFGNYPLYGASGLLKKIDFYHQEKPYIGIVKDGSGVGRVGFYPEKSSLLGTLQYILPKDGYDIRFVGYALKSLDLASYSTGAAIPHIYFKDYGKSFVCVPPSIEEQKRIVAELDILNDIIVKKNDQLRDLDNLAQSIFYEMFGDPVINDKGWETMVLSSVSQLLNGRAYKQDELLDSGKYKVIRVGNFFTNSEFYYSDLELEDDKYCDYGDLLFAWSASFGAFIWSGEKVIYHYHIWKVLFDENKLDKVFYQYLLNTMTSSFMKDVHGIGMVHLTKSGMEQYVLPIPPLDVQKSFAERISAIESQKSSINESLIATQTLLDSRMNAYFNC